MDVPYGVGFETGWRRPGPPKLIVLVVGGGERCIGG